MFVTPRSIDRCVATLRAKVEPDPHNPIYIQTIREIGYRFEPSRHRDLVSEPRQSISIHASAFTLPLLLSFWDGRISSTIAA